MQQTTIKSDPKETPSPTGTENAALPPPSKQTTLPPSLPFNFNTTVTLDPNSWSIKEIDTFRKNKYEFQAFSTKSDIPLKNGLRKGEIIFSATSGDTLETFWRIDTKHQPPISLVILNPDGTPLHTHVLREAGQNFARLTITSCKEGRYIVQTFPYDVTAPEGGIKKSPDILMPVRTEFVLLKEKKK